MSPCFILPVHLYLALKNLFISTVLAPRPVHERLGITPDITAPKSINSEPVPSGEIRIKTLEEIRQEKAAKSQIQCKGVRVVNEVPTNALTSTKKVKKPVSGPSVKTFSEILHEKKKLQETKVVLQQGSTSTEKTEGPKNTGVIKLTAQAAEIRVKTLEEIRKEKAARMQAKPQETTNDAAPSSSDAVPKRQILCIGKTGCKINVSPLICHLLNGLRIYHSIDIYLILFTAAINIRSQKVQDSEKGDCSEEASLIVFVKSSSSDI